MKLRSLFGALALVALVAGCATTPQSPQKPAYLGKLAAMHVDPTTYNRIAAGRVLSYQDILNLVTSHVPDKAIVGYLKSTRAPYHLTDKQLLALTNAGAGSSLVNYLGSATGFYDATKPNQTGRIPKWERHPYFNDAAYVGAPPFAFGYPGEWNDPAFSGFQ